MSCTHRLIRSEQLESSSGRSPTTILKSCAVTPRARGFDFPLLLDPDGELIESWGLLNTVDHKGRRIPHPAMVLVDIDGVVRYVQVETNYRLRPAASETVEAVEQALQ